MGSSAPQYELVPAMLRLPVDDIEVDPVNERRDLGDLDALMDSIRTQGLLEPLVVYPTDRSYRLQSGHRRLEAIRRLGWTTVDVVLAPEPANTAQQAIRRLASNLARADIDPILKAMSFRAICDSGVTQRELARQLGISQPAVAQSIRLLDLPPKVQEMVRSGQLAPATAGELLRIQNDDLGWDGQVHKTAEEFQVELAKEVSEQGLSQKALRKRISWWRREQTTIRKCQEEKRKREEELQHEDHDEDHVWQAIVDAEEALEDARRKIAARVIGEIMASRRSELEIAVVKLAALMFLEQGRREEGIREFWERIITATDIDELCQLCIDAAFSWIELGQDGLFHPWFDSAEWFVEEMGLNSAIKAAWREERVVVAEPLYFGCWDRAGHHLWDRDGKMMEDAPRYLFSLLSQPPWESSGKREQQPEGRAVCEFVPTVSATRLSFWDRSIDDRAGSYSTFWLPGYVSPDQVIEKARSEFPAIFSRFGFPMVLD